LSDPVFMFCSPGHVLCGAEDIGSRFHVLRSRHVFDGTESVGSRIHVLHVRTRFRQNRVLRLPFSCLVFPESYSAVRKVPGPIFMFCALGLIFGGNKVIGSRFHVLLSRARFRWYGGRRVSISCFALPDSFSAVPRLSGPIFMFCVSRLIFGGTEGVGSRFRVLRFRTHLRRFRGRCVSFSCFAHPDTSSAVPRSSSLIFMFYAPGVVSCGTEGVGSRFHVLRSRTRFRRCRVRRVPFSCFPLPNSFSSVLLVPYPVFMFSAPDSCFLMLFF
jgi:hypothetical protein